VEVLVRRRSLRRRRWPPGAPPSHLDDELGVGEGEAQELVLVQVHDEQLVRGRQLHRHLGELLVKVTHVTARFLRKRERLRRRIRRKKKEEEEEEEEEGRPKS